MNTLVCSANSLRLLHVVNFSNLNICQEITYTEGNKKVDFLSNIFDITLPQETWQTNFGAICREKRWYII